MRAVSSWCAVDVGCASNIDTEMEWSQRKKSLAFDMCCDCAEQHATANSKTATSHAGIVVTVDRKKFVQGFLQNGIRCDGFVYSFLLVHPQQNAKNPRVGRVRNGDLEITECACVTARESDL